VSVGGEAEDILVLKLHKVRWDGDLAAGWFDAGQEKEIFSP
jgi:hypothetical protein